MIRAFINRNTSLSARFERRLARPRRDPFHMYEMAVRRCLSALDGPLIVDIGGGKSCSFAGGVDRSTGARIVAVDISEEELRQNMDVDDKRQADIARGLPFPSGTVDLLVSRTVLEHVSDVESFIAHSSRVMRPGGFAVHLFPCRYAPFAIVARATPFGLAKRILHYLRPDSAGVVEFPVYYDKCYPSSMRRLLLRYGFRDVRTFVTYYQSDYFTAFFPAYVISALYDAAVQWLGFKNLAAYAVVVARR
jgi:SAM-dependent methyltransferase